MDANSIVTGITVSVIGGGLLWVILYLIKLLIQQTKEITQLKSDLIMLKDRVDTEIAVYENKIGNTEQRILHIEEEQQKIKFLFQSQLAELKENLGEKMNKIFDQLSNIRENVATINERTKR